MAGANFNNRPRDVTIQLCESRVVLLPASSKGRCSPLETANDGGAHGDASLQQVWHDALAIASMDGSNVVNGLGPELVDAIADAPDPAIRYKPSGERPSTQCGKVGRSSELGGN
nr:hypothetical protein [Paramyrothecium sp.]